MIPKATALDNLRPRLQRLYPGRADWCLEQLKKNVDSRIDGAALVAPRTWNQRDAVLITYGDQLRRSEEAPLATLHSFLTDAGLNRLINTVHLLPFYPYSSDDGFSVIDYRAVDPKLGDWDDVRRLGTNFRLAFDLVLNHASQHSHWFQQYLAGQSPYDRYFIEADPAEDLSAVVRPRSLPLLTPYETSRGTRHLWTTFSADQVDLNFAEPAVLLDLLDVLLFYIRQGARIIRLDAIAYLWKEPGTSCIHLPQTHEVVKLMRALVDAVAPGVLLLTETNVPHRENISYFGDGDEAHMVYQFSLAPLLLDAFISEDAGPLNAWLANLSPPSPGTSYFNFTASHDGVGVRPLEGLVSPERLMRLVEEIRRRGGLVSTRRSADGADSPYELNVSYFDAVADPDTDSRDSHVRKFLATQAVMLALQGIPGIYFHSLVGTPGDLEAARRSGVNRAINRRKFAVEELRQVLGDADSAQARVFAGYQGLLSTRIQQQAFHPDAAQEYCDLGDSAVVGFLRMATDGRQRILVAVNVSGQPRRLTLPETDRWQSAVDLLSQNDVNPTPGGQLELAPYQVVWLASDAA